MSLRDLVSHWFENRKLAHYEELEKIIGSLVENYKQKLVLLNNFSQNKITKYNFALELLDLLKVDSSLEALGETLAKKEKTAQEQQIIVELQRLRQILDEQNKIVRQEINFQNIADKVKQEGDLLALEQKEVQQIEANIFGQRISESELNTRLKKLEEYGLNIDNNKEFAVLLASNWDFTHELIKKFPQNSLMIFQYGLLGIIKTGLVTSREDLALLVSLAEKTRRDDVFDLFEFVLPKLFAKGIIKSKEDLALIVELAGKAKQEDVYILFKYGILLTAKVDLIKSREDLIFVFLLLVKLIKRTSFEENQEILMQGLPFVLGIDVVKSKEGLALLVEQTEKAKPKYISLIFRFCLPFFGYLIKSRSDLVYVFNFSVHLSDKLYGQDVKAVFYSDYFVNIKSTIKNIDDLKKINDILPELLTRSHRLYKKQASEGDEEFFDSKSSIVRREFEKTGSRTILLGGKLVGKAIIRIVSEPAFFAWKSAFEAKKEWKNAGFDYIPVEPILTKKEDLRAYKTKDGNYYRVYTKVLGLPFSRFVNTNQESSNELIDAKNRIIQVLNALNIQHGHLHDNNFCVGVEDEKVRVYVIDFDQASSK